MLFPISGLSSLSVMVAQPDERHANRTASVLEWYETQSIHHLVQTKKNLLHYFDVHSPSKEFLSQISNILANLYVIISSHSKNDCDNQGRTIGHFGAVL